MVAVSFGMLCVLQVTLNISLRLVYNRCIKDSGENHCSLYKTNVTAERDQLQTSYNTLTEERDQLQTSYNNLTEERDQLQTSYNSLTEHHQAKLLVIEQYCQRGWRYFDSSLYFLSTEEKTWEKAEQDCLGRGAHLVIINSEEEQKFLIALITISWIGLTERETEGTWKWVDGTPLTTRYWAQKQPDNSGPTGEEDCAEINDVYRDPINKWNDVGCTHVRNWICERAI